MMPPDAPDLGIGTPGQGAEPAVLSCPGLVTLRRRTDFLRAAAARRQPTPGFLLQARAPAPGDATGPARIGYTCSKKLGNAVARNRAKRRLREIARLVLSAAARPGWDYVLVGRPEATATRPFSLLLDDLERAVAAVHADRPASPPRGPRK